MPIIAPRSSLWPRTPPPNLSLLIRVTCHKPSGHMSQTHRIPSHPIANSSRTHRIPSRTHREPIASHRELIAPNIHSYILSFQLLCNSFIPFFHSYNRGTTYQALSDHMSHDIAFSHATLWSVTRLCEPSHPTRELHYPNTSSFGHMQLIHSFFHSYNISNERNSSE